MQHGTEKSKNFSQSIKRLWHELAIYRIWMLIGISLAVFSAIFTIISPNQLSKLTDKIQEGLMPNTQNIETLVEQMQSQQEQMQPIQIEGVTISVQDQLELISVMQQNSNINTAYSQLPISVQNLIEPKMDLEAVKNISLFLLTLYICAALASYIQSLSMTELANQFAKKLRTRISIKINKLPLSYFDNHQTGDVLSRLTNDIDTISQSMNQSLAGLVNNIILLIGTLFMMFKTNYIMAFTAIASSIIGLALSMGIMMKSQKYFVTRQKALGALNGHIEEVFSSLNVIKAYNGQQEVNNQFTQCNEEVYLSSKKSMFLSGLMQPLMGFIGNFGYVAVCVVGAVLTKQEVITFGVIVAFMTYVRLFTNPLTQIAQAVTSLQQTAASSERVFEFLDEQEMKSQNDLTHYLDPKTVKGTIEFDHVEFTYDGNNHPTIQSFTASCQPGQKIAIVGPTGAGKTTMVNLLMKFYDISGGDIRIDGVSTSKLTRENIHDLFTMVLQDTWQFDGTIKENIKYNNENVTDEQIIDICKKVGLDHFIRTLPKGYDNPLDESDSISVGQRQLLTIARGMVKDSPFLILDEATSNVDTRTEELVQKAMDQLTVGKTSFIIAHRLSTIRNADLILVMNHGNIIEQGTHEQLLQHNGFYANLYNSQFENYIDE